MKLTVMFIKVGLYLLLHTQVVSSAEFKLEPVTASWQIANGICGVNGHTLVPGRRYRASGITKLLAEGESVWLNGWRILTDVDQDNNGRVRTLKVDVNRGRKNEFPGVCKTDTDTFFVPVVKFRSMQDASATCVDQGAVLANLDTVTEIRSALDAFEVDTPHWINNVTSDGSVMKQCLAAKKTGSLLDYDYHNCKNQYRFICFRAEALIELFSPFVSLKMMRPEDVEEAINTMSSTAIPTESETVSSTVIPTESETVSSTPIQTESKTMSSTPIQTESKIVSSAPIPTESKTMSSKPIQTESKTVSFTPTQTESKTVSSTPIQAESKTVSSTPIQAESKTVSSTPIQAESKTVSSTPIQAESKTVSSTPIQTESKTVSSTPIQTESKTVSSTPIQAESKTVSSTPTQTESKTASSTSDQLIASDMSYSSSSSTLAITTDKSSSVVPEISASLRIDNPTTTQISVSTSSVKSSPSSTMSIPPESVSISQAEFLVPSKTDTPMSTVPTEVMSKPQAEVLVPSQTGEVISTKIEPFSRALADELTSSYEAPLMSNAYVPTDASTSERSSRVSEMKTLTPSLNTDTLLQSITPTMPLSRGPDSLKSGGQTTTLQEVITSAKHNIEPVNTYQIYSSAPSSSNKVIEPIIKPSSIHNFTALNSVDTASTSTPVAASSAAIKIDRVVDMPDEVETVDALMRSSDVLQPSTTAGVIISTVMPSFTSIQTTEKDAIMKESSKRHDAAVDLKPATASTEIVHSSSIQPTGSYLTHPDSKLVDSGTSYIDGIHVIKPSQTIFPATVSLDLYSSVGDISGNTIRDLLDDKQTSFVHVPDTTSRPLDTVSTSLYLDKIVSSSDSISTETTSIHSKIYSSVSFTTSLPPMGAVYDNDTAVATGVEDATTPGYVDDSTSHGVGLTTRTGYTPTSEDEFATSDSDLTTRSGELTTSTDELTTSTDELTTSTDELTTSTDELRTRVDDLTTSEYDLTTKYDLTTNINELSTNVDDSTPVIGDSSRTNMTSDDAPETESTSHGVETSLWIAFVILVVAVCFSLILAAVLWKRRKSQKSKDISSSNGAAATATTDAHALRERSTSPTDKEKASRESTTFLDNAYDL